LHVEVVVSTGEARLDVVHIHARTASVLEAHVAACARALRLSATRATPVVANLMICMGVGAGSLEADSCAYWQCVEEHRIKARTATVEKVGLQGARVVTDRRGITSQVDGCAARGACQRVSSPQSLLCSHAKHHAPEAKQARSRTVAEQVPAPHVRAVGVSHQCDGSCVMPTARQRSILGRTWC
jgi:hypothetical protein